MRNAIVSVLVLGIAAMSHRTVAQAPSSEVARAAEVPIVIATTEIKWVQVRPGQETSLLGGSQDWAIRSIQ